MEISISVIRSRAEKIGKNVICIGGTDQLIYGQSHKLCYIRSKNISKVSCGNAYVDALTKAYLSL